jgi:hypothetical protein
MMHPTNIMERSYNYGQEKASFKKLTYSSLTPPTLLASRSSEASESGERRLGGRSPVDCKIVINVIQPFVDVSW